MMHKLLQVGLAIMLLMQGAGAAAEPGDGMWHEDQTAILNGELPVPSVYPEPTAAEQAAFAAKAKEIEPPSAWDEDADAYIRLNSDSRMVAPSLSLLVPKRDETFTIFFREAMDRSSVEQSIKQMTPDNRQRVYPKLLMHWTSDKQLHIKALVAKAATLPSSTYYIDLQHSLTKTGKSIRPSVFAGTIQKPQQLRQVGLDGSDNRQLTMFDVPYQIQHLDEEGRYWLLGRTRNYCPCDKEQLYNYSVYDSETGALTDYPVGSQLRSTYRGEGHFTVDRRGFFYTLPNGLTAADAPKSDFAREIRVNGFVQGAAWSKDRKSILLAVTKDESGVNPDLKRIDIASGEERTLAGNVKGGPPLNEVTGAPMAVQFIDDGIDVYFYFDNLDNYGQLRYKFNWKTNALTAWEPPLASSVWAGFRPSSDGTYKLYANAGFYQGEKHVYGDELSPYYWSGLWVPNTHDYVMKGPGHNFYTMRVLHADERKESVVEGVLLSPESELHLISPDGKWLTVSE